jgi:hypothetical protein
LPFNYFVLRMCWAGCRANRKLIAAWWTLTASKRRQRLVYMNLTPSIRFLRIVEEEGEMSAECTRTWQRIVQSDGFAASFISED